MSNSKISILLDYDGPNPIVTPTRTSSNWKRLTLRNLIRVINGIAHGSQFRRSASSTHPSITVQSSVVQASATATPVAVILNDTLSIAGTALTAKKGRASSTCTVATAIANDTVTINGVVFTGVTGAAVLGSPTFSVDTGNTETATSIAAQVNAYASPLLSGLVAARSASAVVTFYAVTPGTAGNAITLTSSSNTTLAVTGAGFLAGGAALTNNQFDFNGTDVTTGQAIAAAILASTTAAIQSVTATASSSTGVVTVTAKAPGVAGNAVTFTSSDGGRLAVTGSGFLAAGSAGAPTVWTL
jgi:phage tail sheath gpL-like